MDAIFWMETVRDANGYARRQLQYSQTVLLNFNGLSWPHVSLATLVKQQRRGRRPRVTTAAPTRGGHGVRPQGERG